LGNRPKQLVRSGDPGEGIGNKPCKKRKNRKGEATPNQGREEFTDQEIEEAPEPDIEGKAKNDIHPDRKGQGGVSVKAG